MTREFYVYVFVRDLVVCLPQRADMQAGFMGASDIWGLLRALSFYA